MNVILTIITGLACYFPISLVSIGGVGGWLIKAGICTGIINIVFYLRYKNTDEFNDIKLKVLGFIKKRN